MSWLAICDRAPTHAKVVFVGNEAYGALVRMAAHSAGEGLDGFVPEAVARMFAGRKAVLERLCTPPPGWPSGHGLLERVDGGYRVHDFADYNPTAEQQAARAAEVSQIRSKAGRAGAAKRWQAHGKPVGKADGKQWPPSPAPTHTPNDQGGRSEPARLVPPASAQATAPDEDPEVTRITAEQRYEAAYVAGIEAGKGAPYVFDDKQRPELHKALKFAEGRRNERLLNWIREAAQDFATDMIRRAPKDPKVIEVYSSFGPRGFAKWLNAEERNAEAKAVGS